jgi:hypothetical protein
MYDLGSIGNGNSGSVKMLNSSFFSLPILYIALAMQFRRREGGGVNWKIVIFFHENRLKFATKLFLCKSQINEY